jgi:small subunit ribosomal protein S6
MRRRMPAENPLYDLVLLLDTQTDQERREAIVENVSAVIEQAGELVSRHDWGVRPTAFEVRKRADADYHLLQFHGPVTLLEQLDHSLKITDGVLRFRITKLRPGTPPAPDLTPAIVGTPVDDEAEARRPERIER